MADRSGPRLRANRTKQKALLSLLREIRVDAGLSQEDLAHKLGVPQSMVSKFESGERRLDLLELHAVCTALGMSVATFIQRYERAVQ